MPKQADLTLRFSGEPGFNPSREANFDDVLAILGSFNIVDVRNEELRLPGYPRAPLLPTSLGQVAEGTELTRLWVTTEH
jgi:hypothetical protein